MKSNLFACCFVMSSFVDFLSKKAENDTKRYGRIFGVATATLRNWRKEKPNLYKTVMKGFEFDKAVEEARLHYEKLKEISEKNSKNGAGI